jgi:hypothetical protein
LNSPLPNSWSSFNRYHFCIYMHVYTFFALYSPSYLLSPPLVPSHWCQPYPPWTGPVTPSCSPILQKRKDKKKNMAFLLIWAKYTDKDTGSFHVIFPACMCYIPLVHLL